MASVEKTSASVGYSLPPIRGIFCRPGHLVAPSGPEFTVRVTLTSPTAYRTLSLWALAGLWIIVPSGALVRLTDSGLGCPDVPLCDNRTVVPALEAHALIEFVNRILSAAVVLACVAAWYAARRALPPGDRIRHWSGLAALMTIAQLPLGAVTVLTELHPLAVGSHFLLSMLALAAGTLATLHVIDGDGAVRRFDPRRGPLAALCAVALGGVLVSGVLVTSAGPHSGDREVLHRFWRIDAAAAVHVRVVVVFLVLALVLALWLRVEGSPPDVNRLAAAGAAALAAQIAIGEYQYRAGLPWQWVAVHVSLAALVWAVGVALAWRVARPRTAGSPQRPREASRWQSTQRSASGSASSRPAGISPPQSTQIP